MDLAQQALRIDPYSAPVNFMVARLYDESGRFDEAMTSYLHVVEIEPGQAFAYVYIAAIHYLVYGRIDESIVWYGKAAEKDAMSPSLQAAQALAYIEIGDAENAEKWVDRAMTISPDTFWTLWASILLNLYTGDDEAAQADARAMAEIYPRAWGPLRILRDADIAAGRLQVARSRYARSFSELTEPEIPNVDIFNYQAAVDFALVLKLLGETDRANDLVEGSLTVMSTISRGGVAGYWLNDVRAIALQDEPDRALASLREAINEGWRFHVWYHMDIDPNLDSIRGTAEFDELHSILQADLDAQAEHVREMKASGELAMAGQPAHH